MSNSHENVGRAVAVADFRSMAKVSVGQVLGLVEAIDEVGGVADVATISQEVDMDLDRLGPVLGAAEFLGLLAVEEGDVRMTDLSRKLLHASVRERKAILRRVIDEVPVFRMVLDAARQARRPLERQEVLDAITARTGSHQAEDLFKALVYWGRYVELLQYDSRSEQVRLRPLSK
jgi:NitT/TauT family transport system ATP-binding protein